MNLIPKATGTRPRVACEITPRGVVVARSTDVSGPLGAIAKADFAAGVLLPSLKPGNVVDKVAVTAALRRVLESIGIRSNSRGADITLVIPDTAVRVLLLDFDTLPTKLSEALPLVRFRLKKLLPFDADDAMVTFQIMSSSKSVVRVLAVAMPRDVLDDYETVVRGAGYEPGTVLPSTLAALAAVDDAEGPVLMVNANRLGITAAIVRGGVLLLHRSVDLQDHTAPVPANLPAALFEPQHETLPLVDREQSAAEWAAQQPLPEHGRNPYADRAGDEAAVQNVDSITGLPVPPVFQTGPASTHLNPHSDFGMDPYAHAASAEEIAQAVSVAAAYFEDTLSTPPSRIVSAGPLGAAALNQILSAQRVTQSGDLQVHELVESSTLFSEAVSPNVPRGWLAGVLGALRG